ncbi:hypothetical protein [Actinomadura rayongensis]|uniref:Uncharacterized protein n=1 Tax=Actinomadura rayongensis TaxID=1429076 RepID=A0A6I4WI07_9ACTN|nr:hypothetical protein [Actinomadura rayongensis]MXQ66624.1 hypothetical protein [Actinomadura rayongensis]
MDERPATPGAPLGFRETSGVEVRIVAPGDHRGGGRRTGFAAVAVAVLAVLGVVAFVFLPGRGDDAPPAATGADLDAAFADAGRPVDVSTADGSRYRVAAVTGGASGSSAYIEYVLANPSPTAKALLDFPADLFLTNDLLAARDRGRCMWQAGVPDAMCTPPTRSEVVRGLAGGALLPGDGDDRYLPPASAFLVRTTVQIPVRSTVRRADLRLYLWKKLYVDDQYARLAPFPR